MKTLLLLLGLGISQLSFALSAGQPAPHFSLSASPANPALQLKDFQGKVVYLDFWASWCPPCAKSFPLLNQLRADLGNPDFEVVAINVDEKIEDMQAFLRQHPVDFVTAWDKAKQTPALFEILGMPTAFLVDKQGKIRHIHSGFRRQDVSALRAKIEQLLQE